MAARPRLADPTHPAALPGIAPQQFARSREVLLDAGNQPVVFAHSVDAPLLVTEVFLPELLKLGR